MLAIAFYCLGSLSVIFFPETIGSDFSELGRQLLAGFVVAVAVAVSFTVIKLRRRDKHPPAPFISIINAERTEKTAELKANGDS
ncbi:MAG TPA: hypothetical protein VMZ30_08375 [Pyrinomonadaceae bacterium]|nr:hypothetical protein [Pyrinomonadaceae bacterium]